MRALISVSDKTGIVDFAKELAALGFTIVSTGGTFDVLQKHGLKVIPINEVTGFPEMMDGRVKTLHPKIHGGLLSLRKNKEHMAVCKEYDIPLIDMVVVNLYPFEKTVAKKDVSLAEAIENIDIGGPSMLRSASKNYADVAVIVNPEKYATVIAELRENKGKISLRTKELLALEAFQHTARYDSIIAEFLEKRFLDDESAQSAFPSVVTTMFHKVMDLRYGENPHQQAAFYRVSGQKGLPETQQLHGKELSFNNILDLEAAWSIAKEFELPAVAIIKHTNPCGTAVGDTALEAYQKAYAADPVSAFGSIVGINRSVDLKLAEEISKIFVEVIIAPDFDDDAFKLLSQKQAIRLIKAADFFQENQQLNYRQVSGGFLVQSANNAKFTAEALKLVTKKAPTKREINDLLFAFTVVKHIKSNAIVVVKDGVTLGVGAGQMSRIDSVKIALEKAGDKAKGAVVASDAFFPFGDSVEEMAKYGITAIVQPGGSKRDQDSVDAANKLGISMVFTDIRCFKH
jgi:phosphoribosylaminoimidazolecarboxamide formyltransferase/IMP cyclohydrolase